MKKSALTITQTAMMIAIIILAQYLGSFIPTIPVPVIGIALGQLVTGALVNLTLILSAYIVGLIPGMMVGLFSSILAQMLGISKIPQMLPVIAIGNVLIVAVVWAFFKISKGNLKSIFTYLGIISGAGAKCAVMWILSKNIVIPSLTNIPEPQVKAMSLMFSWPQGVTALAGGILALLILPVVKKAIKKPSVI